MHSLKQGTGACRCLRKHQLRIAARVSARKTSRYHSRQRLHVCAAAAANLLSSTRPIDRLRYQAKLVFEHFDTDKDGILSPQEFAQYVQHSDDRFGKGKHQLDALYNPIVSQGQTVEFEQFVELVRKQVAALSTARFLESQLKGAEIGRLLFKCAIPSGELAAALAVFKLVDFNNDGFVRLDEYNKVQGVEKRIFDDVLEDADANDDGFLTFEDFLTSYAKERPVFLSMAVMLAHTAAFWLILNSPLDVIFKAVLSAFILLRPAIITNPIIKIWQIGSVIFGRARAEIENSGRPDAA